MRAPGEDRISERLTREGTPVVPSGGAWSGNTLLWRGYIVGIRCRPATATTMYNLTISDRDGYKLYEAKGLKGEESDHEFRLPVAGVCTVAIAAATVDEAFDLKIMVEGL